MEARQEAELPRGAGWQYEPKWDGFRCLAIRDGDKVEMLSRSGKTLARYFPERAQRTNTEGRATISCTVSARGTLEGCAVVSEDPDSMGFGGAALQMAKLFKMKPQALSALERDTIEHSVETIRNRVDALGVTEPLIAPEGGNRIVIQLPGVDDPARVKDIIKTTAQLQFRLVEGEPSSDPKTIMQNVAPNMQNEVDVLPGNETDALGRTSGLTY